MGDIEKLIKKKLEVETLQLDNRSSGSNEKWPERAEERPRGRASEGRRREQFDPRDACWMRRKSGVAGSVTRTPVNRDPFFQKPYEPSTTDDRTQLGAQWSQNRSLVHFGQHQAQAQSRRLVQVGRISSETQAMPYGRVWADWSGPSSGL